MPTLSDKQKAKLETFAQHYVECGDNAAEALRRTGTKAKPDSIRKVAQRLLDNPYTQACIDALKKKTADAVEISIQDVLRQEMAILQCDVRNYVHEDGSAKQPAELDEKSARAVKAFRVIERTCKTGRDETETIRTYEYEYWDKGGAAKRVGEHLNMYEKDRKAGAGERFSLIMGIDRARKAADKQRSERDGGGSDA